MNEFDRQLVHGAMPTPLILPEGFHQKEMSMASVSTGEDWSNAIKLTQLAERNELVYVYTLIQQKKKLLFSSSSVSEEEIQLKKSTSPYYSVYDDAPQQLNDAFETGKIQFAEYTDKWGTFRSVFIPLETKDGFRYVTASDIEITHISLILQDALLSNLLSSLLALLFIIPFILAFHWQSLFSNMQLKSANSEIEKVNAELKQQQTELEETILNRTKELETSNIELTTTLEVLAGKNIDLQSEVSQRKRMQDQLDKMALFDGLTTLPNRVLLKREAKRIIAEAKRYNQQAGFMFLDLDGFKAVNDTYGHDTGDVVLVEMSLRLKDAVREIDIVGRYGGDEFVIILPNCNSASEIIVIAERILYYVKQPIDSVDTQETLTASIGISFYPDDADSFESLISYADKAMYEAKMAGKNQYHMTSNM